MDLDQLMTKDNLKTAAKVAASVAVGVTAGVLAHNSGATEWLAELENWRHSFGTRALSEYAVPFGTYVYDTLAGIAAVSATYVGLNKLDKKEPFHPISL